VISRRSTLIYTNRNQLPPDFVLIWRSLGQPGHFESTGIGTRRVLVRRPPRFACRSRATAPKLDLTLGYQSMTLNGTPGQALIAYYAEPGTLNTTRSHFSIARTQTTSASLTSDASTSDPCLYCAPDRP
jgi:hypothetical protein